MMGFKLKNKETEVSAEKSILRIEELLTSFGANAVMKEYSGDGKVRSLSFKLEEKAYKLPVNKEGVYKVLFQNSKQTYRVDGEKNRGERAYRVAWRILKDWLHSQLSITASGQAQPEEVLLPYMFDGKKTLYQAYKDGCLQIEAK